MSDDPTIGCIPFKPYGELPPRDAQLTRAAVRSGDSVYTGWRHAHIIWHLQSIKAPGPVTQEAQGFVDQHGNFYSRYMAGKIAAHCRQIKNRPAYMELTSESLWDSDGTPHWVESDLRVRGV